MRKRSVFFLLLLFSVFLQNSCGLIFYKASGFGEASRVGLLNIGMTQDQVKELLGDPDKSASRQIRNTIREVWKYKETTRRHVRDWLTASVFSLGLWSFVPVGAEVHLLIFSDGAVIGWDLPDPYDPDIIIEKKEIPTPYPPE